MHFREVCPRCRRPSSVCFCGQLVPVETKTRVVFLQHPRERRVAIGTARMAHLSLPNSELHTGVDFAGHARVNALAALPGTAVLFPGEGAVDPRTLQGGGPEHLIVVDGTWPQAKKVLERNPLLRTLPRVGLVPRKPGNYRIRKEPTEDCLSTIEAVVEVLGQLEGDHDRFDRMLSAFVYMVDRQIQCHAERVGPPRYKLHRKRNPPAGWLPHAMAARPADWVLVYGEANAHPNARFEGEPPTPELLHLVATRPSDGERFEAVLRARTELTRSSPHHLELPPEAFSEERAAALARFAAFLRGTDVLCGWGFFTLDLLRAEGLACPEYYDVRGPAVRVLKRRPGGIEQAAALLGASPGEPWARGRAGRRMAGLQEVVRELAKPRAPRPPRDPRSLLSQGAPQPVVDAAK